MKLSHFLSNFSANPVKRLPEAKNTSPSKTESTEIQQGIRKVERAGKTFFVIDGGATSETKKPTTH